MGAMYEELFQALENKNIRYLVVGGVAVVLHGFLRATADLDLMVDFEENNVLAFLDLMKSEGYKPKPPVPIEDFAVGGNRKAWKDEKGMLVFSLRHPIRLADLIDVFVDEPIPFKQAYERRQVVKTRNNTRIDLISVPDLIRLKKAAGRAQDMEDIRALNELQERGYES